MPDLIGLWIDIGIIALAAFLLLRFYLNPVSRLYKKKWVPFAFAFMLLLCVARIDRAYRKHSQFPIPTEAELAETLTANGTVLSEDLLYSSRDGYQVLIPAGYLYAEIKSGIFSLAAANVKEGVYLGVSLLPPSEPLSKLVAGTKRHLKKSKNSTYAFLSQQGKPHAGMNVVILEFEVTNRGIPYQGLMAMFKKRCLAFLLTVYTEKSRFPSQRPEFETILQSFTIKY